MRTPLKIGKQNIRKLRNAMQSRTTSSDVKLRIRALLLIARGKYVPTAAKLLSLEPRTVRNWAHRYLSEGLNGLKDRRTKGRPARLSAEQMERLKQRIEAGPMESDKVCSLRGQDIRRIIYLEFGQNYSLSGVYYLLNRQMAMSYIKPRPRHHKADPRVQKAFKKTSQRGWNS